MKPSTSWPENLPSHRKRAIQELIKGRKLASQLHLMLRNSGSSTLVSVDVDDLAVQIMATFNDTLSMLNFAQISHIDQVIPAASNWDGGGISEEDHSSECSKTSVAAAPKDRRGCYKRRKTSLQTCERVTSTLVDDGHAWRKYGQKQILNAKHPRNYYRCTHKFEQGCKATKQVQKTDQDDPPMYRTTYHGPHTCRNIINSLLLHKPPPAAQADQIILADSDSTAPATSSSSSSCILSFEYSNGIFAKNPHDDDKDSYGHINFPTMIRTRHDHDHHHHQYYSKEDMYHSPAPAAASDCLTTSGPMPPMLSAESSSDVLSSCFYSCTTPRSFGMMVGSPNFDDFQFEFCCSPLASS